MAGGIGSIRVGYVCVSCRNKRQGLLVRILITFPSPSRCCKLRTCSMVESSNATAASTRSALSDVNPWCLPTRLRFTQCHRWICFGVQSFLVLWALCQVHLHARAGAAPGSCRHVTIARTRTGAIFMSQWRKGRREGCHIFFFLRCESQWLQ